MLAMSRKYKGDDRFKLDARFIDSDASGDDEDGEYQEATKADGVRAAAVLRNIYRIYICVFAIWQRFRIRV